MQDSDLWAFSSLEELCILGVAKQLLLLLLLLLFWAFFCFLLCSHDTKKKNFFSTPSFSFSVCDDDACPK